MLSRNRIVLPTLFAAAFAIIYAGICEIADTNPGYGTFVELANIFTFEAAILLGSFGIVFRLCGYRLVARRATVNADSIGLL